MQDFRGRQDILKQLQKIKLLTTYAQQPTLLSIFMPIRLKCCQASLDRGSITTKYRSFGTSKPFITDYDHEKWSATSMPAFYSCQRTH